MTTANGQPLLSKVRGYINTLTARRDYLIEKRAIKVETMPHYAELPEEGTWEGAEIAAINYALEVLEADWDTLARMRRNVQVIEGRLGALERNGVDIDCRPVATWVTE